MPKHPKLVAAQSFTPNEIASGQVYQIRSESGAVGGLNLQERVAEPLTEGRRQIALFGEAGVGKSSLINYVIELLGLRAITVACLSSMSLDDILLDAIAQVAIRKIDEWQSSRGVTTETGLEASVPGGATKFGFKLGRVRDEKTTYHPVESGVLREFCLAMDSAGIQVVVIDNFENLENNQTKTEVGEVMKTLFDLPIGPKLCVVGISNDAQPLLTYRSNQRRVTQILVPRMKDIELRRILDRGFERERFTAPPDIKDEMVAMCDGFPYYAHLLGLNVVKGLKRRSASIVTVEDLESAKVIAVASADATMHHTLDLARDQSNSTGSRERALALIVSDRSRQSWTLDDVVDLWQETFPDSVSRATVSNALNQLSSAKYGSVLQKRVPPNRRSSTFVFSDPNLRVLLKMELGVTKAGLGWLQQ